MIYAEQQHGLHKLSLDRRAFYNDQRLIWENGSSLGDSPHVAGELEVSQIIKKLFGKYLLVPEICNVLVCKGQLLDIVYSLLQSAHNRKAAVIGNFSEIKVKAAHGIGKPVFQVAVAHGQLVEICEKCKITVVHHAHILSYYFLYFYSVTALTNLMPLSFISL